MTTTSTTQGEHAQTEALRLANSITWMDTFTDYQREELDKAAAELRRLHAQVAALTAAPAPAAQADSVLEDAMGLVNDIDTHMRSEWSAGRLPAVCWPLAFSDRIKALRAASKQGAKHD